MKNLTYQRIDGVQAREVGDEIFLVVPATGEIHHLNAIAAAVWRVLEDETSRQELEQLLGEAFADVPLGRIKADIAALLASLLERDLIAVRRA